MWIWTARVYLAAPLGEDSSRRLWGAVGSVVTAEGIGIGIFHSVAYYFNDNNWCYWPSLQLDANRALNRQQRRRGEKRAGPAMVASFSLWLSEIILIKMFYRHRRPRLKKDPESRVARSRSHGAKIDCEEAARGHIRRFGKPPPPRTRVSTFSFFFIIYEKLGVFFFFRHP